MTADPDTPTELAAGRSGVEPDESHPGEPALQAGEGAVQSGYTRNSAETQGTVPIPSGAPDTPTADAPATCNSGVGGGETCALPRGHSGPHDPDAPYLDFSPANMARLREKALQNYIDTADAPTHYAAPTNDAPGHEDIRFSDAPADTDEECWRHDLEHGEYGCTCRVPEVLGWHRALSGDEFERFVVEQLRDPSVIAAYVRAVFERERAQVEAARRDALNQAADAIQPPNCSFFTKQWLRQRAARGETRQPADTDTGRGQ